VALCGLNTNWNPWANLTAAIPRMTTRAHARRMSSAFPFVVGGLTRNERISPGSTTKSYENTSYEDSNSEVGGKYSTVRGRQPGVTTDFHLISCLYMTCGNICCHRRARDPCAYDTEDCGRDGSERKTGEDEENWAVDEVTVALRRLPNVDSSRGGVVIGERRAYELG
jgi:hypothetical protein